VVSSTARPHYTPEKDPVPVLEESVWDAGLVWMGAKIMYDIINENGIFFLKLSVEQCALHADRAGGHSEGSGHRA